MVHALEAKMYSAPLIGLQYERGETDTIVLDYQHRLLSGDLHSDNDYGCMRMTAYIREGLLSHRKEGMLHLFRGRGSPFGHHKVGFDGGGLTQILNKRVEHPHQPIFRQFRGGEGEDS